MRLTCIFIVLFYVLFSLSPSNIDNINTNTITSCNGLYFAISRQGNLISWGNNEYKLIGDAQVYPYIMRKAVLKRASLVSAGYSCVMAVDKNNTLWGWGHPNLLLTNYEVNYPVKVMNGVKSVSVGTNHIGAIMDDSSLLVWGFNSLGQLGLGYTDERPILHEPEKIMNNVKSIFFNEDISFAITQNGDLYAWGGLFLNEDKEIIAVDTPAYIASNIQDIAYQSENIFQLLQIDGKLIALDLRLVEGNHGYSPACTYPLVPGEVKTIYHSGVNMNNDSHWTWVKNLKQVVLMKRQDKIILEDGWFKVSEKGYIYSRLPFFEQLCIPHSFNTLDPYVRAIFILFFLVTMVFKK